MLTGSGFTWTSLHIFTMFLEGKGDNPFTAWYPVRCMTKLGQLWLMPRACADRTFEREAKHSLAAYDALQFPGRSFLPFKSASKASSEPNQVSEGVCPLHMRSQLDTASTSSNQR